MRAARFRLRTVVQMHGGVGEKTTVTGNGNGEAHFRARQSSGLTSRGSLCGIGDGRKTRGGAHPVVEAWTTSVAATGCPRMHAMGIVQSIQRQGFSAYMHPSNELIRRKLIMQLRSTNHYCEISIDLMHILLERIQAWRHRLLLRVGIWRNFQPRFR